LLIQAYHPCHITYTDVKMNLALQVFFTLLIFYDQMGMQLSSQSLSHDACDMRIASRITPPTAMEANHYMSFSVQTLAKLIDSFGGNST